MNATHLDHLNNFAERRWMKSSSRLTGAELWSEAKVVRTANGGHAAVDKSIRFMAANYWRPIQLKDVVKVSGLSRRGFMKAFEKHTGETPGAVIRRLRLGRVKQLLAEEDLKLVDLARQCGFQSENTLCVAFQREVGIPPKKYQKQYLLSKVSGLETAKSKNCIC